MCKQIAVVEPSGKALAPTYPRRAKGLVKQGRARYVDAHTICILSPPMDKGAPVMSENITPREILARIDRILNDTSHLQSAFMTIEKIPCVPAGEPDSGEARAQAISAVVCAREETNREILALLQAMYDDLYVEVEDNED